MTTWYADPTVSSGGTGSIGSPWPIATAASSASIQPGDTVYLRAGAYPRTIFTRSGSSGSPITYAAYPADSVPAGQTKKVRFGGDLGALAMAYTWELYDAPTSTWRTVETFADAEMYGHVTHTDFGGQWYPLATHKGALGALMASGQDFIGATNTFYGGPGITERPVSGHVYIRLVTPDPDVHPGVTNLRSFPSTDPNDYTIRLHNGTSYAIRHHANYLLFDGLEFTDAYFTVSGRQVAGAGDHIIFRNCLNTRFGLIGHSMYPAVDITWENSCVVDGNMDPTSWWVAWEDVKNGHLPFDHNRKNAFGAGGTSGHTITPALVTGVFDGILGSANNCVVGGPGNRWSCWDDLWQTTGQCWQLEIGGEQDNPLLVYGAGPSHDSTSANIETGAPGTIYVHHGIYDPRQYRVPWGRRSSTTPGMKEPIGFSTHGTLKANEYAQPWKVYHNTVIAGPDSHPGPAVGPSQFQSTAQYGYFDTRRHYVMNNIFINMAGDRKCYDVSISDDGSVIFDGNVYHGWETINTNLDWPIWAYINKADGTVITTFYPSGKGWRTDLLRSSVAFTDSQAYYAPGWEASGLDLDPALDVNYVPGTAAVLTGAVNLVAFGWPGADEYVAYRGAVAPLAPVAVPGPPVGSSRRRALL